MVSFKAKSSFDNVTVSGGHLPKIEVRQNIDEPPPLGTTAYHNTFEVCIKMTYTSPSAVNSSCRKMEQQ